MDPEPIPFRYDIAGCLNGAHAEARVEGHLVGSDPRYEVSLVSPDDPLLWNADLVALALIDPVIHLGNGPVPVPGNDTPSPFRIEAGVHDDGDMPVGRLVVSGALCVDDTGFVVRAQLTEGLAHLESLERVRGGGGIGALTTCEATEGRVVTTRCWTVETSRENTYIGTSVAP